MIDLGLLRDEPEKVTALLHKKDPAYDVQRLITLDQEVRALRVHVETLRHKKNELAQQGKGGITPELRDQSVHIGKELKGAEERLCTTEQEFMQHYLRCPNIPLEEVPEGGKEANWVVSEHGKKPEFSFPIKNHVDLGNELGWLDWQAAATMSGAHFALYKDKAVELLYSLLMFMLKHNKSHGYQYVFPPYLVHERSLEIASNFPKFRDEVYAVPADQLYLIPTAEVSLANLYRDMIVEAQELPLRFTAATSCFRREAGGYGAAERGLIRIHQFEKVELFTYCEPEQSEQELEKMLACAQELLQKLELPYRVVLLAGQDCSFPSAKTYDLEVFLPSQNGYKEVSSCSNCTDFQARRGGMRYRQNAGGKPRLMHTLNGSSLALPRVMAAIMELYQQPDGSVVLPSALRGYGLL
jgi:seryl-tRNA synthetase